MSLTAADIMSTELISATRETTVRELAELLVIHRISGVLVLDDDGSLAGIVSQSDLVAQSKNPHIPKSITLFDWVIYLESLDRFKTEIEKMAAVNAGAIMTREVITVPPETPLEDVATIMTEKHVHTIPVVEGGRLLGVIGKLDIVRSLLV